jgi:hypothetical protein
MPKENRPADRAGTGKRFSIAKSVIELSEDSPAAGGGGIYVYPIAFGKSLGSVQRILREFSKHPILLATSEPIVLGFFTVWRRARMRVINSALSALA